MPPISDHELRLQSWLAEHGGILGKVARSFTTTSSDYTELHQDLQLQLWISLKKFSGDAKVSTWIYRVCLNTALTWKRGTTRRTQSIDPGADPGELNSPASTPADHASERDLLDQLYAAIHTLPAIDRALVLLSLDEVPYRDIATVTGMTENHVGVALTRARQRLAAQLKGVTDELK
jgi:RNA polymerase sigma-70 factor, ECF subfamily